jgi:DNA transformation protein
MTRNDDIAWHRELLAALGPVDARRMFGGTGLYADGRIVALAIEGVLFLKTDAASRARFRDAGGRPFAYDNGRREVETSYWTPPDDALDSADAMAPWARLAREAALRAGAKAKPAAKKTAGMKTPKSADRPAARARRTSP